MNTDGHSADVLGRARAGDERAFLALYRAAQPGLVRYLSVLVGGDAEQVAALTWAEVNRELAGFDGELDSFRTWAAGIGRRLAREHLDRQSHDSDRVLTLDPLAGPTPPRASRALRLIAELPRAEAEVVTLRAVMGMGEAEVASMLGQRPGAVRRAAERGLRALTRRLQPVPVDPIAAVDPIDALVEVDALVTIDAVAAVDLPRVVGIEVAR